MNYDQQLSNHVSKELGFQDLKLLFRIIILPFFP